jgi:hypothetical protein
MTLAKLKVELMKSSLYTCCYIERYFQSQCIGKFIVFEHIKSSIKCGSLTMSVSEYSLQILAFIEIHSLKLELNKYNPPTKLI